MSATTDITTTAAGAAVFIISQLVPNIAATAKAWLNRVERTEETETPAEPPPTTPPAPAP